MNYGQIFKSDTGNGIGVRLTLFVSGCTNCCEGCFQPETWDFNFGDPYTKEIEDFIMDELSQSFYQGLTILGGEPFEPSNQKEIVKLIRRVKEELPQKDIWVFTGFTYEEDLQKGQRKYTEVTDEILDSIDVLVDGRFILAKKNIMLKFRGSSNQRIIDMPRTRSKGEIVLHPLNN